MALTSALSPLATSSPSTWLQADGWNQFPGLVHGFSHRIEDRNLALAELNAEALHLYTLTQVHGDDILIVHQESDTHARPEADGLMSRESGVLLGIATADCVPVLMVAPEHGLIAALHAGWRGTLKGISQHAVKTLNNRWQVDPESVWVALGPSISPCCYEVGRDVGEALHERWRVDSAWQPTEKETKAFSISALSIVPNVRELEFQRHRFSQLARALSARHMILLLIVVKVQELDDNSV